MKKEANDGFIKKDLIGLSQSFGQKLHLEFENISF